MEIVSEYINILTRWHDGNWGMMTKRNLLRQLITFQTWSDLFRWHHSLAYLDYPPNAVQDLTSKFGSLSHLKELDLRLKTSPNEIISDFSFESFSDLRILSVTWAYERRPHPRILSQISRVLVRSPDIERFSFSISQAYHLAIHRLPPRSSWTL